ncbi:MAG: F0F1 ATP synthase subunit A [Zetaproteobacteria bacterium CG_4_9_14_3_um_filter_49_83]|nr:MAG: F0F1 ATP synthase subunit A [Zetaproteobacteria bacterium CG1_02_49_23]PIQ30602.1 MAG: F0F1 ATP synthase subunit A [Zetaproteobacteria bacterium CG17_big_fil_post_rev_8_21_14_2_50_50_13]PIV30653.1 MAG: F0F1 ATP synthase subunit A [Zetaproteobacteria bacterium CG02_land_8_20_14_3_00_50_9]PIY55839.1 MAG: F0F1 ATP synthase subunit A [Zetaproteobacteria bacterium CG_4_10_14_0_8_um_filter_49_80]PJA34353.1 MAG: F0F1 ATP synthase subunit A [Zetaproteobacteria bacterium CG_4_9_14_3_um_filter_49
MSLDLNGTIEHFRVVIHQQLNIGYLDLSISNSVVFMWMAVALVFISLRLMTARPEIIPKTGQLLAEMLYSFVARQVTQNIHNEGAAYIPLMFTLFTFILGCNLIGLIPGAFTPTSQLAVTGTLAAAIFGYAIALRFYRHGLGFFRAFVPSGVPKMLLPLMIPIELISFLARPLTLALRLFANMTAGHMALGVLAVLGLASPWFMRWLPLGFTALQIALELVISFIQAYIFMILSCVYIDDALSDH